MDRPPEGPDFIQSIGLFILAPRLDSAGADRYEGGMRAHRYALLLLATTLPTIVGCGSTPVSELDGTPLPALETLLIEQTELYPLMGAADLYKLVSQATRGPAIPFIGTQSGLDTGLEREVRGLKVNPTGYERELEALDRDRNLVRINLRPFLLGGGKLSNLARAVGETHRVYRGDRAVFLASLDRATELLEEDRLVVAFDADRFREHLTKMKELGYPPGIHSADYTDTYAPAYRIVRLDTLSDRDYGGRDPHALLEGLPAPTASSDD